MRQCGTCNLCCTLLPVVDIDKPAATRCKHLSRTKGCKIYDNRPISCRVWSCTWLLNLDADGLSRPDRVHYVIDTVPDIVKSVDNFTGKERVIPVVQVWCDPKHPDAHKDPGLREFLQRRALNQGMAALIRYNSSEAIFLCAPALSDNHQWHEVITAHNPDLRNPFISEDVQESALALAEQRRSGTGD